MKRDYKAYFCGGRFGKLRTRLIVSLIIWLYVGLIVGGRLHYHPTPLQEFGEKVEWVIFCFLPIFLLPVILWGTRRQRIFAWLLAFIPLANWFVFLMDRLGID